MAGIVITSVRKSGAGCDHRLVTVALDGESFEVHTGEGELDAMPWTDAEKRQFILLGLKRLRVLGLALDNAPGRVCNGEEATNVKTYDLMGPGNVVAKTNIGTSYVNVLPGANGERVLIDFTGCTEFRVILTANLVGTGPFGARVVRDSDNAVLFENASIAGGAPQERELDTDWQTLPGAAGGLTLVRLQAKSTVGADDPQFRRCVMLVR
jgi:hypothetical protein